MWTASVRKLENRIFCCYSQFAVKKEAYELCYYDPTQVLRMVCIVAYKNADSCIRIPLIYPNACSCIHVFANRLYLVQYLSEPSNAYLLCSHLRTRKKLAERQSITFSTYIASYAQ